MDNGMRYLPRDPRLVRATTSCDDGVSVVQVGARDRETVFKKDSLHIHDAAALQLKTHRAKPKA